MDMATTLAALDTGLITAGQAREIACGIRDVIQWGERYPEQRPTDYLDVQALLLKQVGPVASRMHAGRSRQDMLATLHRLLLRDRMLLLLQGLLDIRALMLQKGAEFQGVAVPTYTNGVQAQPALFGHLMCGYEAPLARNTQRYREAFPRLNQSPLGAAALATTRFNLDRRRIALLLGFDTLVDNAFDAAQLGLVDTGVECAQIAALIALNLNMFIQDLHAQFHHTRPWITFCGAALSSPSTLMPQKRNPVVLNRARLLGSEVMGASVTAALAAHNLCSGLTDYKRMDASRTLDVALEYLGQLKTVINGMQVDEAAALEELDAEYSTTSELAALLQEASDIPLAITHAFCSRLVDAARAKRLPLAAMPHDELCALFEATLAGSGIAPAPPFPYTPEAYRHAVHPMTMINHYRGQGGSSPVEVDRMMQAANESLRADRAWFASLNVATGEAARQLDRQFDGVSGVE